mmetsp:Transcript_21298/g.42757  ORF Transcript_21298/g.42757 Transcript_21298/m.42757 type:complete len:81 (-) Transcript_21298:458-700(-)
MKEDFLREYYTDVTIDNTWMRGSLITNCSRCTTPNGYVEISQSTLFRIQLDMGAESMPAKEMPPRRLNTCDSQPDTTQLG